MKPLTAREQELINTMYVSVRDTYERIVTVERAKVRALQNNPQWNNIMKYTLGLMLATDADDAFLDDAKKMKEYDELCKKYLGMKIPTHQPCPY